MQPNELTDDQLRELILAEMDYDFTIVNPHLGLKRLSTADILKRVKAKQARARKAAEKEAAKSKAA